MAKLVEAFSGPRDWPYPKAVFHVLHAHAHPYRGPRRDVRVVFGDAKGVDAQALAACKRLGLEYARYEADWDGMATLGKPRSAAGPIRNGEILAIERPALVRVFSYGNTRDLGPSFLRPWREIFGRVVVVVAPGADGSRDDGALTLVAYPLTRGTGDMAQQAIAAGIPVAIHDIWGAERLIARPQPQPFQANLFIG